MARVVIENKKGEMFLDIPTYGDDTPEERAEAMKVILKAIENAYLSESQA